MKADLTKPENRAAFMALYFNQWVMEIWGFSFKSAQMYTTHHINWNTIRYAQHGKTRLSLRPISSLTEEEGLEIERLLLHTYQEEEDAQYTSESLVHYIQENRRSIEEYTALDLLDIFDFLRSIGILIPFRGNSCEEIIEAGLCVYRKEGE